ncbi:MAG: HEAT repeat domain-containing protein [Anaerolineae bacterium]|nr:HEAT repeat domain-containing protein [Anaerolineae bacterium]
MQNVGMYTVNQSEIAQWVNLLEEKGAARLRALSQLGRIGVQARGHRSLRRGSLRAPARSFLTPAHLAQLLEALSDSAPVVRRETAFVLGELGGETAISALGRLATDPNADVRLIAVDALAKIGGPRVVQALAQTTHDDSELVRARAVHALGRLARGEEGPGVEPIRETLTRIREGDASAYVQDAAREALVALEGEDIEVPTRILEPL